MAICKHYEKISSGLALGVFMVVLALLAKPLPATFFTKVVSLCASTRVKTANFCNNYDSKRGIFTIGWYHER
jgi:hypothetical protein